MLNNQIKKVLKTTAFSIFLLFTSWINSEAADIEDLMKKVEALTQKVESQQNQLDKQNKVILELKTGQARFKQERGPEAIPSQVIADREEIKKAVAQIMDEDDILPDWIKGFNLGGDFRLRYQGAYNRDDSDDRHRERFRLRISMAKKLNDEISLFFRLAGAEGKSITGTDQSFDEAFGEKEFWIDRAYAVYRPKNLSGLELGAGKFANPFVCTKLVWSDDVNPEGAYERYRFNSGKNFRPFITLGQMLIYEDDRTRDASLFAYQAGFDWDINNNKWTLALTYYDYMNLEDSRLIREGHANGNTVKNRPNGAGLASDFNLVNITTFFETKIRSLPITFFGDYVKNISSSCDDDSYGYSVGFDIGKMKHKGDWSIGYKYGRIEPDAVVGAFNDADFGHSNTRGSRFALRYKLFRNVVFEGRMFVTDSVSGPDDQVTEFIGDLNFNF